MLDPKIEAYLDSKKNSWSESTMKSERARLAAIPLRLLSSPEQLLLHFKNMGYAPYTINTMFIRAAQLSAFIGGEAAHLLSDYMRNNSRVFRGAYTARTVGASFDATLEAISTRMTGKFRDVALGLLYTGLRISELMSLDETGHVIGKGRKFRKVINHEKAVKLLHSELPKFRSELRRATGLYPHSLRKLAATRAVELGAREAELLKMFGWSSMQTASIYVQARNIEEIASKF